MLSCRWSAAEAPQLCICSCTAAGGAGRCGSGRPIYAGVGTKLGVDVSTHAIGSAGAVFPNHRHCWWATETHERALPCCLALLMHQLPTSCGIQRGKRRQFSIQ
eukprot:354169-Chlamydomonas_euryale.AAC.16